MKIEPNFKENNTTRIWADYFFRVQKIIKHLSSKQKEETLLELKSHLYESFQEQHSDDEVENLLNAIEMLGKPEEFLRPIVSEKMLADGRKALHPKNLVLGILYSSLSTVKVGLLMIIFSTGYFLTFLLGILSILKIFMPNEVGVFLSPKGYNIGITEYHPGLQDVFGYWFIPLGLIVSCIIYYLLSFSLRLIISRLK